MRCLWIILALFVTSCCCGLGGGGDSCGKDSEICDPPIDPEIKALYYAISRTIFWYTDPLPLELGIYLRHSYVYRDECGGLVIWMDFYSQNLLDVDEARRIMVETVEGFLGRLNVDPETATLADGLPFTYENMYVSIEYESYFGQYVDPLYVARTELKEGYFTASYAHTSMNERAPVFHKHVEPYESSRFFIQVEDDIENSRRMKAMEKEAEKMDALNWRGRGQPFGPRGPIRGTGASRQPPPEYTPRPPLNPALLRTTTTTTTSVVPTVPTSSDTFIQHTPITHPSLDRVQRIAPPPSSSNSTPSSTINSTSTIRSTSNVDTPYSQ